MTAGSGWKSTNWSGPAKSPRAGAGPGTEVAFGVVRGLGYLAIALAVAMVLWEAGLLRRRRARRS